MSVKVLVRVDRKAALKAIRVLDDLSSALAEGDIRWPKKLKRKYQDARAELVPNGETHAVLTVVTSAGDYVLDNLTSAVLPWNSTKLVWIARQVPGQIDWGRIETAAQMARAETTATDMR